MQPTNNTNGIVIDVPVNIPTPVDPSVTYFFNSADSNRLYYKMSDNTFFPAYDPLAIDPCLCEMASKTLCTVNQALIDKTITITEFETFLTAGHTFSFTNGSETWTITLG